MKRLSRGNHRLEIFRDNGDRQVSADTSSVPDLPLRLQLDDGAEEEGTIGDQAVTSGEVNKWLLL